MSQDLPVNNFERIKDTSVFSNEDFIKDYNEESDKVYFLEVDVLKKDILKNYMNFTLICRFYLPNSIKVRVFFGKKH